VLALWLMQQLLLLARELNPPLVDVAINERAQQQECHRAEHFPPE
jgi:hypothetical protein